MSTTKRTTRKAYLIQESGWDYNDEYYYRGGAEDDKVVTAYRSRARAEAEKRQQEERARHGKNPFEWGGFWSTSRTEEEFLEIVAELGLPPPRFEFGCYQWMSWWSEHERRMTTEQKTRIWEAMDLVHFYEVVEVEVEG
jgi:hypothetical protein